HRMDSLVAIVDHLTSTPLSPPEVPALLRLLGTCSTPGCRLLLGDPPELPPTLKSPNPAAPWPRLTQLVGATPELGVVLAPDGSTVALGPLFAGLEVGLKQAMGSPIPTLDPPVDALYAVTLTEALATSFLVATEGNRTALGPDGCWDDRRDPQNYTLLGPPSLIPDAVANGAMDGVLLGTQLAQAPVPLAKLLRGYYGTAGGNQTGRLPSSYRRQRFGELTEPGKLQEEVAAVLRLLRGLPPTGVLLRDLGEEEVVAIASRAALAFTQLYIECPAIVPRCMWGAAPYRGTPALLSLPLGSVFVHHSLVPGRPCRSFAACARDMRRMQRFHQRTRRWDDLGYSFVVGSDGYLYEGRGWHWVGAHTKGYNTRGYGLAFVGNFTATKPDPDTLRLLRDHFLPCAIAASYLHPNYTLWGHRQLGATQCPGDALFQEISSWRGFQ
ncbi:PGRP2 amidase, partial [Rhinopomastus cyanomelas]|nr:PGRP2 amidase [Rhinopomastus cyanomelas]